MNAVIRNIDKSTQKIIWHLKDHLSIKTTSKLLIYCVRQFHSFKMISKQKDQEIINLRSELQRYKNFENDIKSIEPNKDIYENREDLLHKISNSLYELNNEDNEDDYY